MKYRLCRFVVCILAPTSIFPACSKSSNDWNAVHVAPSASISTPLHGGLPPAQASTAANMPNISGKVVEKVDVPNYTYLNLETSEGKKWVAVPKAGIASGSDVVVERPMPMRNFHSSTLNRDFAEIYFGVLRDGAPSSPHGISGSHLQSLGTPSGSAKAIPTAIRVSKATGPNVFTVSEIVQQVGKLKDKAVTIRGMVVKVNTGILERNWIHIQDGTGSAQNKDNDLLVTSQDVPALGDVVLVTGKVAAAKDFGSGYAYDVMLEEGKVTASTSKSP